MIKAEDKIEKYKRTDLTKDNHDFLDKIKKRTALKGAKQTISKLTNNALIYCRKNKLFDKITGQDLTDLY